MLILCVNLEKENSILNTWQHFCIPPPVININLNGA